MTDESVTAMNNPNNEANRELQKQTEACATSRMTDITWEQAREKVRKRHGDVYEKSPEDERDVWQVKDYPGGTVLGFGDSLEAAYLNAYARMTASQPKCECEGLGGTDHLLTCPCVQPERIAAVTELPPHETEEISVLLTPDPWEENGYWHLSYASGITGVYHSRQAALEAVKKYVASQAAEMAALRSAKEKAEATARVGKQVYAEYRDEMSAANAREYDRAEAAEAENTRLRGELEATRRQLGKANVIAAINLVDAALSTPATKKEG